MSLEITVIDIDVMLNACETAAMKRPRFEGNRGFYVAVGRRIAKARTGRLTQEALAQKATLTRTSIVNIEKGRQQILLHTVVEIAQALAIPVTDLLPEGETLENLLRSKSPKGRSLKRSQAVELKR